MSQQYNSDPAAEPNLFTLPVDVDIEGVSVTERFEAFHARNPAFYTELVKLARRFRDRTGRTCGIQRLVEIARWDIELTLQGDDEFKVNNNYAAYYARLIMLREPDLRGFFAIRRADEADMWAAQFDTTEAA